ncbi:MAG: hypothetical protein WDO16_16435 [Bacteroidota bacterium]
MGATFVGNILLFIMILVLLNRYFFDGWIHSFQNRALPWIMGHYESLLRWAVKGWRPVWLLIGAVGTFFFSIFFFAIRGVPVVFFPDGDPNQIYVYVKLPTGTRVEYTDSITRELEKRVYKVLDMDPNTKKIESDRRKCNYQRGGGCS